MLLCLEDRSVGFVEFVNALFLTLVGFGVCRGLSLHAFDLVVRQTCRSLDADLLLLAGSFVLGADVQDTVGVDIEGYLDLRFATTCRHDTVEVEDTDLFVLGSHRTLALEDFDLYRRLVVNGCGEGLGLLGRDRGVRLNHAGHHAAHGLYTEAQRSYIQQQYVLHVTGEYTTLDSCTYGYHLVRVNALRRSFAEELLYGVLYSRDTG